MSVSVWAWLYRSQAGSSMGPNIAKSSSTWGSKVPMNATAGHGLKERKPISLVDVSLGPPGSKALLETFEHRRIRIRVSGRHQSYCNRQQETVYCIRGNVDSLLSQVVGRGEPQPREHSRSTSPVKVDLLVLRTSPKERCGSRLSACGGAKIGGCRPLSPCLR